jgi:hypothetical protein
MQRASRKTCPGVDMVGCADAVLANTGMHAVTSMGG